MPRGIYPRKKGYKGYWFGKKRGPLSEETKRKQSKSLKGRKFSSEVRQRMSLAQKGKRGTYGHLGHKHSEETKKVISQKKAGRKHSIETRKKMSVTHLANREKHPSYKGGITPINKKIRGSSEYKLIREACFERDNYTCIWCGARSGKGKKVILHADHIKPFSLYPELRFALDNLRTLCIDCHSTTDSYLSNFNKNYKQNNKITKL